MDGVVAVHDVHVWTITSGLVAMSGHVVLEDTIDVEQAQDVLERIDALLADEFEIKHTTMQIEHESLQEEEVSP